uniref:Uncharacterized protein n=1 Tax=Romanomermis culicivorax TaxID=13658 RepID=A0A915L3Z6_ROMCU
MTIVSCCFHVAGASEKQRSLRGASEKQRSTFCIQCRRNCVDTSTLFKRIGSLSQSPSCYMDLMISRGIRKFGFLCLIKFITERPKGEIQDTDRDRNLPRCATRADVGNAVNCPKQIEPETCKLLGPTDWYLAFDSKGNISTFFRPLVSSIFDQTLKKLKFDKVDGHRLSIFEATVNKAELFLNLCERPANSSELNLTGWVPKLRPNDNAKTGIFEMLDSQMAACRRSDYQSIALKKYHEKIKVKKDKKTESTELEKSKIKETASQLINCICYKSEDCHTDTSAEKKLSKCYYVVENKTTTVEDVQCVGKFGGTIFFKPRQKLRPFARPCYQTFFSKE